MAYKIERRPMTLFFNETPVEVVTGIEPGMEQSFLAGEWCTLVRWPSGDVDWRSVHELRLTPKQAD
jgi:hypothetical protein